MLAGLTASRSRKIQICAGKSGQVHAANTGQDRVLRNQGIEQWQLVGHSLAEVANVIRVIVANPVMIKAYQECIPGNGELFPNGSRLLFFRPSLVPVDDADELPGVLAQLKLKLAVLIQGQLRGGVEDA